MSTQPRKRRRGEGNTMSEEKILNICGYVKIKYENGSYEGDYKNGKRHGRGKMKYADGNIYDGMWLDNRRDGYGKMTYNDGCVYDGMWECNFFHCGKMKYLDGSFYKGFWKYDLYGGYGEMTYPSGKIRCGLWIRGKLSSVLQDKSREQHRYLCMRRYMHHSLHCYNFGPKRFF